MTQSQSEALSHILSRMATKDDLILMAERFEGSLSRLRGESQSGVHQVRADLQAQIHQLRTDLQGEIHQVRVDLKSLEARLTRQFIIGIAFLATVMTLLDLFVD